MTKPIVPAITSTINAAIRIPSRRMNKWTSRRARARCSSAGCRSLPVSWPGNVHAPLWLQLSRSGAVIASSVVIRLAGQDLVRSIHLLEQDDSRDLVRERDQTQRQAMVDLVELEPERSADHEAKVLSAPAARFQEPAETD